VLLSGEGSLRVMNVLLKRGPVQGKNGYFEELGKDFEGTSFSLRLEELGFPSCFGLHLAMECGQI